MQKTNCLVKGLEWSEDKNICYQKITKEVPFNSETRKLMCENAGLNWDAGKQVCVKEIPQSIAEKEKECLSRGLVWDGERLLCVEKELVPGVSCESPLVVDEETNTCRLSEEISCRNEGNLFIDGSCQKPSVESCASIEKIFYDSQCLSPSENTCPLVGMYHSNGSCQAASNEVCGGMGLFFFKESCTVATEEFCRVTNPDFPYLFEGRCSRGSEELCQSRGLKVSGRECVEACPAKELLIGDTCHKPSKSKCSQIGMVYSGEEQGCVLDLDLSDREVARYAAGKNINGADATPELCAKRGMAFVEESKLCQPVLEPMAGYCQTIFAPQQYPQPATQQQKHNAKQQRRRQS